MGDVNVGIRAEVKYYGDVNVRNLCRGKVLQNYFNMFISKSLYTQI